MVGYLFSEEGRIIDDESSHHTIAIPIDVLRHAARVIAVAAGPHKVAGIIGASRTGLVHSLVTDEPTALAILERLAGQPRGRKPRARRVSRARSSAAG